MKVIPQTSPALTKNPGSFPNDGHGVLVSSAFSANLGLPNARIMRSMLRGPGSSTWKGGGIFHWIRVDSSSRAAVLARRLWNGVEINFFACDWTTKRTHQIWTLMEIPNLGLNMCTVYRYKVFETKTWEKATSKQWKKNVTSAGRTFLIISWPKKNQKIHQHTEKM